MDEDDDFLAAVEADNERTPVEPKVETPPEPNAEPVKAEPEVLLLDTPATPAEIAAEPPKQDERPPLAALLDERDKRKTAEAERDALRASQQQQPQYQMPDPYEDPEGFAAAQEAKVGQALYQTNLRWSERIATIEHGKETVAAAKEWAFNKCNVDPYFNAKVASSEDPLGFAVHEYKREEIASKVTPDEFAQFQAWKNAQDQIQTGGQPPPPPRASAIPSPSLASAPSAGTMLTEPVQADDEIFDEVIPKR